MAWIILHSSCQLGYRLILSSTRRSLPTDFIMNWTRQTTTFVWRFHPSLSSPFVTQPPSVCIDDPETFKHAPICIQVIGKTMEEEAVIAMGEIVDSALKTKLARSKPWFCSGWWRSTLNRNCEDLSLRDIIWKNGLSKGNYVGCNLKAQCDIEC